MKQTKIWMLLMMLLACFASCGSDDDDDEQTSSSSLKTITVELSSNGMFSGRGLLFKVTSYTENTACVYTTATEIDRKSFTGGFDVPAYIEYEGVKYTVTSIEANAFYECYNISSVSLPSTLTEIGDLAFLDCRGLSSVVIPKSVTSINLRTFDGCTGLTSVVIPQSVTEIGASAFSGCIYEA